MVAVFVTSCALFAALSADPAPEPTVPELLPEPPVVAVGWQPKVPNADVPAAAPKNSKKFRRFKLIVVDRILI